MKLLFSVLLLLLMLVPVSTGAQSLREREDKVCSALELRSGTILGSIDDRMDKLAIARNGVEVKAGKLARANAEELARLRAKADESRRDAYARILERAHTDEQKEAVLAYEKAVEAAVSARRAAYDKAITAYTHAVRTAFVGRADKALQAGAVMKSAAEVAFDQASSDCLADGNNAAIRRRFVAALKEARLAYAETMRAGNNTPLAEARSARKQAFSEARSSFEQAIQDAKELLAPLD